MHWRLLIALWAVSLAVATGIAGVFAYNHHPRLRLLVADLRRAIPGGEALEVPVLQTGLYNLWAKEVRGPFDGLDGGIAVVGDGVLIATRTGAFWYLAAENDAPRELGFRVPIDHAAFADSVGDLPGVRLETFGVKDIAVRQGQGTFVLFAGYPHWDTEKSCATYRVAQTELPYEALAANTENTDVPWSTIYETHPCLFENITNDNFAGLQQSGGRIVVLDAEHLLLSVGDYFHDGFNGPSLPQAMDNSYGKTILIGLNGEAARTWSSGHRNPQGLTVAANGDIFLTEHGPQGGDELNRVREGVDYGWPQVTYGTDYGTRAWPLSDTQGRHDGFQVPLFSWVPSVGISSLMSVESPLFPEWRGDLLVASLTARTLFRVHLAHGRAVVVEPIRIGYRIRDIAEGPDGSIVLKADENLIMFLRPAESYERSSEGTDVFRGRLLAAQCSGCHALEASGRDGMGPPLAGVLGRRIASVEGYQYSQGLQALEGDWTPERLREYVRDPSAMARGTTMLYAVPLSEQDLDDLMAFLATVD